MTDLSSSHPLSLSSAINDLSNMLADHIEEARTCQNTHGFFKRDIPRRNENWFKLIGYRI